MEPLLLLTHRIPYPPNKGDKIRSFRWLELLARHYQVHLGTFIDHPADWAYCDAVRAYCASAWFGRLSPRLAKLGSLRGLLSGEPLSLPYYRHRALARWIAQLRTTHDIRRVLVFSSVMAQYLSRAQFPNARLVMDFVDVDSEKWRQYSAMQRFPFNWIYRREAQRLGRYERQVAATFDASLFVSQAEAELFRRQFAPASQPAPRIIAVRNGVDSEYFAPDPARPSPFANIGEQIVFTGAMDYWANAEAAIHFAQTVWPALRARRPSLEFYIVGMNPTPAVQQLARLPGVVVTGGVPDIRPFLQYATAVVVPLRIARGIQNKVLEAMAMGRPVVATPAAREGIGAVAGESALVAASDADFRATLLDLLAGPAQAREALGQRARAFVEREFAWSASLPQVIELLEEPC